MQVVQDWVNHYQPFIDSQAVREGNHPEVLHHNDVMDHAIVLVHGLTDSPHFMKAIGKKLHRMGFNVLIPLLPGHGLRNPKEKMDNVRLEEWHNEVDFAVSCARNLGERVSIGGLSTGGALSTYKAITSPNEITGGLFLFSAALDIGDLREVLLRFDNLHRAVSLIKGRTKPSDKFWGIGDNPYRYAEMSLNGASQLSELIKKIGNIYRGKDRYSELKQPVFAAHSEMDTTAGIGEIERLIHNHSQTNDLTKLFRIQKKFNIPHASVVLEQPISAQGVTLEVANPLFKEMMSHLDEFFCKHLRRK